jgi:hypothetical protein
MDEKLDLGCFITWTFNLVNGNLLITNFSIDLIFFIIHSLRLFHVTGILTIVKIVRNNSAIVPKACHIQYSFLYP